MPTDPDEPVILTQTRTGFEAETIVASLAAHGVEATVADAASAQLWFGVHCPVKVMVRQADLERARDALRAIEAESVDIDWSELDEGTPEDADEAGGAAPIRRRSLWTVVLALLAPAGVFVCYLGTRNGDVILQMMGVVTLLTAGLVAALLMAAPARVRRDAPRGPGPGKIG